MTTKPEPMFDVAFDCDGTLTSAAYAPIGQDNGQTWDLRLLTMCLDAGWQVGVMTCNVAAHVAAQLETHGVHAYADEAMTHKIPPPGGHPVTGRARYVLVTNRKLLALWYLDDRNIEYKYGDPIGPVAARMGLPLDVMGFARPFHRDGGTGALTDVLGRLVPSGWTPDSSGA